MLMFRPRGSRADNKILTGGMPRLTAIVFFIIFLICSSAASNAPAALTSTMYSNGSTGYGATDTSGGLVAINTLQGSIAWSVDQLSDGKWKYTYTIIPAASNDSRGIGSIIIQFGEQPSDLVWNYTYAGDFASTMGSATTSGSLRIINRTLAGSGSSYPVFTYDSWLLATDPAGSRVNVTSTFQGLQWNINTNNPGGSNYIVLDLETSLAPMWGNCYMDGYYKGTDNGYWMMRNTRYDMTATQPFSLSGPVLSGYLPVPGHPVSTGDSTPPEVVSTNPYNGATGVSLHAPVSVTFSESVDPATVTAAGAFTVVGVSGTVTYDAANRTATFTPAADFSYGTTYRVTVTGVKDLAGNAMAAAANWSFTTVSAPDTVPPVVLSVSPENGAQGVAVDRVITAVFSEAMAASTINTDSFTVVGVTGSVSYDAATGTATFTPGSALSYNKVYTATVSSAVRDLSGNAMSAAKTWSFTTALLNVSGDINGNGLLDVGDAIAALRISAGLDTPTSAQMTLGDVAPLVNGSPSSDGKIDVSDAVVILRRIVGLTKW